MKIHGSRSRKASVTEDLDRDVRTAVIEHVLREVYPDRQEAEVVDTAPTSEGLLVGVKAAPNGYLSTAKYALVTVDDGRIADVETCTGKVLRETLAKEDEE